jgi:hypothetical protein
MNFSATFANTQRRQGFRKEAEVRRSEDKKSSGVLGVLACLAFVFLSSGCGDNKTVPPSRAGYQGPEPQPLACLPNLDGKIDASEVQPAIDTPISYLVSPAGSTRTVDVAGLDLGNGLIKWDFGTDYSDDQIAQIVPSTIDGKWYQSSFPADAFVTPFDAADTVENVLHQDEAGLYLHGLASHDPNPPEGQTLVVYDAPVQILAFPIQPGSSFVSVGTIQNGLIRGLQYAGKDTYEVSVDAMGTAVLPSLAFTQAHRVRTHVTVAPAVGASTSRRQVSLFFECFAEVVRATSQNDELNDNFTTAAELRRIGF